MMILLAVTVQAALLVGGISLALFRARAKHSRPALASWSTPIVAAS
jgi:hypothetical protein